MSTITKERVAEIIHASGLEPCDYEAVFDSIKTGEIVAIARIALASLESEPAGYHVIKECGAVGCSVATLKEAEETRDFWNKNWTIKPYFYTAPPAPVSVPDDVSGPLAHAYKELTPTFMRNHIDVFERYGIYPDGSAGIQAMRIALDGMSRRAAMLQGAGGNSPVIPDGWVACSERMPPEYEPVYIFHPDYGVSQYVWYDHQEDAFVWDDETRFRELESVSHWMAMPAPPAAPEQEDK